MLFLSRLKFSVDSKFLSSAVFARTLTQNFFPKQFTGHGLNNVNIKFARKYGFSRDSQANGMILTKSLSKMNPTPESGTINVVKVPNMGKNLDKCKIYKWVKRPGDYVNVDDLLCIIETDLIYGKIYSRLSGTVIENVNEEGSMVSVGSDLAVLANNKMLYSDFDSSKSSSFSPEQKRFFSVLKYIPKISFARSKLGKKAGASANGVRVLGDFYESPYMSWFKSISEEEINMINQGVVDKK